MLPSEESILNVAALTLSISRHAAGMLDCVRRPVQEMRGQQGLSIEVLSLRDDQTDVDRAGWSPVPTRIFSAVGPGKLAFAPALTAYLQQTPFDLVHTFGLWTYLSQIACAWSRRSHRPSVVTPQGMLDPWALANSRWRKLLVGFLYEYRHLRQASCLHATCQAELEAFRAFGLRNPVCIVPNGVDLPMETASEASSPWGRSVHREQRVLLYLGRLHPKKNLPELLRAWAQLRRASPVTAADWTLVIAGWDQHGHAAKLRELITALGIEKSVHFAGALYGVDKAAAYRCADAFVLPSFSEGLPLVVLEAWSHRLPVLMTPACNLPDGFIVGAALRADPEPRSLAAALNTLFRMSETDRRAMGDRGRALVERKFTWSQSARDMAEVYRWLVADAPQPTFVST
ncbi:MAG: glycosyltransferase [Rhodospirillales bacterium]|nr:glycosyltransferase [Acetobacter sp.]